MATEPEPITLFEVAKRAVDVVDPQSADAAVGDFLMRFEDADEPITALVNLDERVAIALEGVDAEVENPAAQMAGAVILYLAHRRDELDDDPADILRLAARAEYAGDPPDFIADWLQAQGVAV
jgi:hypothetical protein